MKIVQIVSPEPKEDSSLVRADGTEVFCDGATMYGVRRIEAVWEPGDAIVATMELYVSPKVIDGAGTTFVIQDPLTGETKTIKNIIFTDGTSVEL